MCFCKTKRSCSKCCSNTSECLPKRQNLVFYEINCQFDTSSPPTAAAKAAVNGQWTNRVQQGHNRNKKIFQICKLHNLWEFMHHAPSIACYHCACRNYCGFPAMAQLVQQMKQQMICMRLIVGRATQICLQMQIL